VVPSACGKCGCASLLEGKAQAEKEGNDGRAAAIEELVRLANDGMGIGMAGSPAEAQAHAMDALTTLWERAITGCDLLQQERMADLFAKTGVEPRWVILAALRTGRFKRLAGVEAIAEVWRLQLSSLFGGTELLSAFGSFVRAIDDRHWGLLAKALEEAQAARAAA